MNGHESQPEAQYEPRGAADEAGAESRGESQPAMPEREAERPEPTESRMQFSTPPEMERERELPPKAMDVPPPAARSGGIEDDQPAIPGASEPPRRGWWKRLIE